MFALVLGMSDTLVNLWPMRRWTGTNFNGGGLGPILALLFLP